MQHSEQHPMFVIHDWQRLYAEALLETDPNKLPTMIMLAEGAISARALELGDGTTPTDEHLELARSSDELTALVKRLSPSMSMFCLP